MVFLLLIQSSWRPGRQPGLSVTHAVDGRGVFVQTSHTPEAGLDGCAFDFGRLGLCLGNELGRGEAGLGVVVVLGGLVRLLDERMAVVGALDELPIHMGDDDLAGAFFGRTIPALQTNRR